jgi:type I restriction-modification system DNA methylase subunit
MVAKRKTTNKKNGGSDLFKELWNAAVALRGSIEPADYKRYVLPLIFLRFLSLRYEQRVSEINAEIADPQSDLFTTDKQLARDCEKLVGAPYALGNSSPVTTMCSAAAACAWTE